METKRPKPNQTELDISISLGLAALRITETLQTPGRESSDKNSIDTEKVGSERNHRDDADKREKAFKVGAHLPVPRMQQAALEEIMRRSPHAPKGLFRGNGRPNRSRE